MSTTMAAALAGEWEARGWTADEERTIGEIQQTEGVDRLEAIRRMQRRKRKPIASASPAPEGRFCRNPNCRRGAHGQLASIEHLTARARFCSDACRIEANRNPRPEKQARNRQCLCGAKRNKIASLAYPLGTEAQALRMAGNAKPETTVTTGSSEEH